MKFKLLSPHYIDDMILDPATYPAGLIVGDGSPVCDFKYHGGKLDGQYRQPTAEMEPLDDEAKAAMEKLGFAVPVADLINAMVDGKSTEQASEPQSAGISLTPKK